MFVMYPANGISQIQRQQMVTCNSENVKVIGVKGNFDDCQKMLKKLLGDESFKNNLLRTHAVNLNTANSINWGRILPQILFHMVTTYLICNYSILCNSKWEKITGSDFDC